MKFLQDVLKTVIAIVLILLFFALFPWGLVLLHDKHWLLGGACLFGGILSLAISVVLIKGMRK